MRLAYLISEYPAVSHTFIAREIEALRKENISIYTCSINATSFPKHLMREQELRERDATYVLKKQSLLKIFLAPFKALIKYPKGFLQTFFHTFQSSGFNLRFLFLQWAYMVEACLLIEWMEEKGISHVHVHFANPASNVAMYTSTIAPFTYSLTVHGPDEFFEVSTSQLKEKGKTALFVCCISDYAKSQLMRLFPPFSQLNFEVCRQGVDVTKYTPKHIETDTPRLLVVARMVDIKGIGLLLETFLKLKQRGHRLHLELIGDGPLLETFQNWVHEQGLTPDVIFHSALNVDHVLDAFHKASLFVLPSFGEGIPVTLMEAMATEVPCISTYVGGIPELIESNKTGILVSPGNSEQLLEAIEKVLKNPHEAKNMGKQARQKIETDYNLATNHKQLATLFRRFLNFSLMLALSFLPITLNAAIEGTVDTKPLFSDPTMRIGLNLGGRNSYGTEQLATNFFENPGFESAEERRLIIVQDIHPTSFTDEKDLGDVDDTWVGATWQRLYPEQNLRGTITHSLEHGFQEKPEYFTDLENKKLLPKDIIMISQTIKTPFPTGWWFPQKDTQPPLTASTSTRPESPGKQSLILLPGQEVGFYIDHLAPTVGKLIKIEGAWRFSIWAKGDPKGTLKVNFNRLNEAPPYIASEFKLQDQWKEYVVDFVAADDGRAAIAEFKLRNVGQTPLLVDDAFLGPVQEGHDPFRKEVVQLLKEMHPSILRDWQVQLSDSLENRLASSFKRGSWLNRIKGNTPGHTYGYSIPELLDLCQEIGALPWIIVSPTWTAEELVHFGEFLKEHAPPERFSKVYLEFGNENWNWMFRPATIPYPELNSLFSEKAFQNIKKGAQATQNHLVFIVNGQLVLPEEAVKMIRNTPSANLLGVAAYYFGILNAGSTETEGLKGLFAPTIPEIDTIIAKLKPLHKGLTFYEINAHTTEGTANTGDRDPLVAGLVSGPALAQHLIEATIKGVSPLMVFTFSQFSFHIFRPSQDVKLWGVTRDLGPTMRLRPTGLALKLLNRTLPGTAHQIKTDVDTVTALAFDTPHGWTTALVLRSEKPEKITITFPDDNKPLPTLAASLEGFSIYTSNEDLEEVYISEKPIDSEGRTVQIALSPWNMTVLYTPQEPH